MEIELKSISINTNIAIHRLKRKGIKNPLEFLRDDLMKNQGIIPNRNTPKGQMYFVKDQIFLINSMWIYAYYTEGHFDGELIAKFEIDDSGDISWEVVDYDDGTK